MRIAPLTTKAWKSSIHGISIRFNPRVWTMLPNSYDDFDGCVCSLIDKKDGSSFVMDLTKTNGVFDYDSVEDEYFDRLFSQGTGAARLEGYTITLGELAFQFQLYSYKNKKFGEQRLARGVYLGETSGIGLSLAWPSFHEIYAKYNVPPKLEFFLDNLVFENVY